MQLSVQNILELQRQGNLKKFASFIYLKQLYSNSCIFNYNIKSLSKKSKLSRHKIRQNINFFLENGWAYFHGKNLVFKKYERITKGVWIIRKKIIFKNKSINEIETILLSIPLKEKQTQFNWIQERKHDLEKSKLIHSFVNLKSYKKAVKAKNKYSIKEGVSDNFKLTTVTIGNMFNLSKSTVGILIKKMQSLSLVNVSCWYPDKICNVSKAACAAVEGLQGYFVSNNVIWKKPCNEYGFL